MQPEVVAFAPEVQESNFSVVCTSGKGSFEIDFGINGDEKMTFDPIPPKIIEVKDIITISPFIKQLPLQSSQAFQVVLGSPADDRFSLSIRVSVGSLSSTDVHTLEFLPGESTKSFNVTAAKYPEQFQLFGLLSSDIPYTSFTSLSINVVYDVTVVMPSAFDGTMPVSSTSPVIKLALGSPVDTPLTVRFSLDGAAAEGSAVVCNKLKLSPGEDTVEFSINASKTRGELLVLVDFTGLHASAYKVLDPLVFYVQDSVQVGTSSEAVSTMSSADVTVQLGAPVLSDLTVLISLHGDPANGATMEPAQIVFPAGKDVLSAKLHTSGTKGLLNIAFELTGSEKQYYQPVKPVTVNVQDSISVDALNLLYPSNASTSVTVKLASPTVTGLELLVSADPASAVHITKPVIAFAAGADKGSFDLQFVKQKGSLSLQFAVRGGDAPFYSVPAGLQTTLQDYIVLSPPPSPYVLSSAVSDPLVLSFGSPATVPFMIWCNASGPASDGVFMDPYPLIVGEGVSVAHIRVHASTIAGSIEVTCVTNSHVYMNPEPAAYSILHDVAATMIPTLDITQKTTLTVSLAQPPAHNLTLALACTGVAANTSSLEPSVLTFDAGTSTATADFIAGPTRGDCQITFVPSGDDASFYIKPKNLTVYVQDFITVDPLPPVKTWSVSADIVFKTAAAVNDKLIVTPRAKSPGVTNVTFVPSTFAIVAGESSAGFRISAEGESGVLHIQYELAGPDANFYRKQVPIDSCSITLEGASVAPLLPVPVCSVGNPVSIKLSSSVMDTLTVLLSANVSTAVYFHPQQVTFGKGETEKTFQIVGSESPGRYWIFYTLQGSHDFQRYETPAPQVVNIQEIVSVSTASYIISVDEPVSACLELKTPTVRGFTVLMSTQQGTTVTDYTLSSTIVEFKPESSRGCFNITRGTQRGTLSLTYSLAGEDSDADVYLPPGPSAFAIKDVAVMSTVDGAIDINTFVSVTVSIPSSIKLSKPVVLYIDGGGNATVNPDSLSFTASSHVQTFNITGVQRGNATINFGWAGEAADTYASIEPIRLVVQETVRVQGVTENILRRLDSSEWTVSLKTPPKGTEILVRPFITSGADLECIIDPPVLLLNESLYASPFHIRRCQRRGEVQIQVLVEGSSSDEFRVIDTSDVLTIQDSISYSLSKGPFVAGGSCDMTVQLSSPPVDALQVQLTSLNPSFAELGGVFEPATIIFDSMHTLKSVKVRFGAAHGKIDFSSVLQGGESKYFTESSIVTAQVYDAVLVVAPTEMSLDSDAVTVSVDVTGVPTSGSLILRITAPNKYVAVEPSALWFNATSGIHQQFTLRPLDEGSFSLTYVLSGQDFQWYKVPAQQSISISAPEGGLSTPIIVAIVVGSVLAGGVLVGICCHYRRKRSSQQHLPRAYKRAGYAAFGNFD
eukprot:GILK01011106.1.p1 GENE.GILK01011106.1~~GILK01011106.1.p1  ORF type:complete len:1451 (+),score=183.76 GILK01011106.1:120-4355(+)